MHTRSWEKVAPFLPERNEILKDFLPMASGLFIGGTMGGWRIDTASPLWERYKVGLIFIRPFD